MKHICDNSTQRQPVIVVRSIEVGEADLLQALHLDHAERTAGRLYRRLRQHNPDLTPKDLAVAVRTMRPMAELFVDAVVAKLERLKPRGPQLCWRSQRRRPASRPITRKFLVAAE